MDEPHRKEARHENGHLIPLHEVKKQVKLIYVIRGWWSDYFWGSINWEGVKGAFWGLLKTLYILIWW